MRKLVKFDRSVRIMIPVWHQPESNSVSKNQLKYKRHMVILDLVAGIEYNCEHLQALLNKGAVISDDDYTYVCSHGFVPTLSQSTNLLLSEVSTGLDPKEDLH